MAAIDDAVLAEGVDRLRQGMALLAVVEADVAPPPQVGISSQSSMNRMRSILPISCNSTSKWSCYS